MAVMERGDRVLFYLLCLLMLFGVVFVYSASYHISIRYTGDPYYFTIRQAAWAFISALVMFVFARLPYQKLKGVVKPLVFLTIGLLLLVFIPGVGKESGGARRWIDLRIFDVNPSEIAKLTVIIYLSAILTKKQGKLADFTFGLLPPLLLVAAIFFIILLQSGFSIAVVLLAVALMLFFVGGASMKHMVSVGIISLPLVVAVVMKVAYRKARVLSFLNPWEDASGKGYHLIQSLKGFAMGGFLGVGLGNSVQKMGRLPTPHTDFIFSVIAEEMGLIGVTVLAGVYLFIFLRGTIIAAKCSDNFGRLLAFGITLLFGLHAFLNMGIAAGIVPPTGVSLPFISYGGSSSLVFAVGCGILLNISAQNPDANPGTSQIKKIDKMIQESM